MANPTNHGAPAPEQVEIVELDDRLDMAFDPMSLMAASTDDINTNCHNTGCCPIKPEQPGPVVG